MVSSKREDLELVKKWAKNRRFSVRFGCVKGVIMNYIMCYVAYLYPGDGFNCLGMLTVVATAHCLSLLDQKSIVGG